MIVHRKRGVLLVAALGTAAALGCVSAGVGTASGAVLRPSASAAVTIDVVSNFTSDIARGQVLNKLIQQFNAAHKGTVQVVSQTTADWPLLQAKIRTEIAVGTPPDVFLYNFNPSDLSLEKYGSAKLINWAPYLQADPSWAASLTSQAIKTLTTSGDTAAIPDDQSSTVVYYNKQLFKKVGITSFPTTWSAFFSDAQKLHAAGIAPLALFTADDAWYAMNVLSALAISAGGTNAYYATHLSTAPLVKASTELKELFSWAAKDAVGGNYAVGSADFLDGHAAMVIDGPWLISSIQKSFPNTCASIGAAAPPSAGTSSDPAGSLITDALTVWGAAKISNAAEQSAAVQWMKFYTSAPSADLMATQGQFPLIVKIPTTGKAFASASCLLREEVALTNAAPTKVVNIERYMTPQAQAQLPNLLEELVLGNATPQKFVSSLQSLNG